MISDSLSGSMRVGAPAGTNTWSPGSKGKWRTLVSSNSTRPVPENAVTLPLKPGAPMVHAAALEQDRWLAAPEMYLGIRAEMKAADLLKKVPQLLKVSSADQIDRLIRSALPGMGLRHVPQPPSILPARLGWSYFLLDRAGPEWDAVRAARNLAVYAPSDFPNPEMDLVILLPQDG